MNEEEEKAHRELRKSQLMADRMKPFLPPSGITPSGQRAQIDALCKRIERELNEAEQRGEW